MKPLEIILYSFPTLSFKVIKFPVQINRIGEYSEGSRSPLNSRTTQGIRNPLKRLAVKRTGGGATESHLGWPAVTDKN